VLGCLSMKYWVHIQHKHGPTHLEVEAGTNLRQLLLAHGLSPYAAMTQKLNCGGHGICATCGVWITAGEPSPTHWHDKLAFRYGYSRLSCQVVVDRDMTVQLDQQKTLWGKRRPRRKKG